MKLNNVLQLSFLLVFSTILIAQNNDDPLNGPKSEYYPSGKIMKEYILSDGVPDGIYKYYSEKGPLLEEQKLVKGVRQGIQKTFYESGQVHMEQNYENGIPQGLSKEYYENGTLKSESNLTGEPWEYSGYTNTFYEDGKRQSESKVAEGKLLKAILYDKEGRVTSEQSEGMIISYWYESDGKKHTSINGVEQE